MKLVDQICISYYSCYRLWNWQLRIEVTTVDSEQRHLDSVAVQLTVKSFNLIPYRHFLVSPGHERAARSEVHLPEVSGSSLLGPVACRRGCRATLK